MRNADADRIVRALLRPFLASFHRQFTATGPAHAASLRSVIFRAPTTGGEAEAPCEMMSDRMSLRRRLDWDRCASSRGIEDLVTLALSIRDQAPASLREVKPENGILSEIRCIEFRGLSREVIVTAFAVPHVPPREACSFMTVDELRFQWELMFRGTKTQIPLDGLRLGGAAHCDVAYSVEEKGLSDLFRIANAASTVLRGNTALPPPFSCSRPDLADAWVHFRSDVTALPPRCDDASSLPGIPEHPLNVDCKAAVCTPLVPGNPQSGSRVIIFWAWERRYLERHLPAFLIARALKYVISHAANLHWMKLQKVMLERAAAISEEKTAVAAAQGSVLPRMRLSPPSQGPASAVPRSLSPPEGGSRPCSAGAALSDEAAVDSFSSFVDTELEVDRLQCAMAAASLRDRSVSPPREPWPTEPPSAPRAAEPAAYPPCAQTFAQPARSCPFSGLAAAFSAVPTGILPRPSMAFGA
eukprot:tig00000344_g24294.t1